MLTNERHTYILRLLAEKQAIKIQELVESTGASESTIRRDLTELEQSRKLERVFGGAILPGQNLLEPSIKDKSTQFLDEKIRIAELASSFVQRGDSVFLDAGTTTFQLIPFLKDKDLVVVTNGLTLVEALNDHGITTYLTGGLMKPRTGAFVGSHTIQALQNYRFDICFLGINGFHADYGYTTPDPEEAAVKQLASSLAKTTYALADHSKTNKISFAKIMDLDRATLIVDEISKEANAGLEKKTTVKVVNR
ncbi:DeoR/GlpR family DNA-binding transcription regulator [Planococcus sp. APC 3900]|uniref:DeoR/GlpR family DNA-binding transcription regulator n=1 Tax=Planococcus sp. APC 3900 TaxID=3035191 RepID=UPI0025B436F4|nr:DeoR/GlpR family DNA-binding transcription regulator [Planococcus sp. APC 3900]MDN3437864.1 DeoR/GlpR family DNA-binding transcription regulator [Planococcus sp. APC 3900]